MNDTTTCCIAGGGPAGVVLGLLLARAGIEVLVLEKHGDFLRDFRGDTVHPSTLEVLDELGLGERFEQLEHRKVTTLSAVTDQGEVTMADLTARTARHPYIAMVPQWDLLTLLTEEASRNPGFRILMNAEAYDLIWADGEVAGVRYRDAKGEEQEVRAVLTVAADGRHSALRRAAHLRTREYGAPMDVAWFSLPRLETDREDVFFRISPPRMMVGINRTRYWQLGYVVPKGGYDSLRAEGIESFRQTVADLVPVFGDRVGDLDFDAVSVLSVQIDRLRRWYLPGLLCIGDAAHAMSPVGGVGINLAVQDAVAAANILYEPLRRGVVRPRELAAVQRRRWLPTALIQGFQMAVHAGVVGPMLRGRLSTAPLAFGRIRSFPPVARFGAKMLGYGPRPEHVRIPAAADLPGPLG